MSTLTAEYHSFSLGLHHMPSHKIWMVTVDGGRQHIGVRTCPYSKLLLLWCCASCRPTRQDM